MSDVITKIGIKDASGTSFDSRDIGAKGQNIEIGYDKNDKIILDVDTSTPVSTKTLTNVLQENDTSITNLNTSKAPNNHRWTANDSVDYGKADATHFGHVRPGTGLYVDSDASSATYGSTNVSFASNKEVAANKAVQGNDSRLSDARKNPNAVTFNSSGGAALGTTYDGSAARTIDYSTVGAAPVSHTSIKGGESTLGHVKSGTGLLASDGALSVKYGTASGTACAGNDSRLSDSRTPKSHATTTALTYGAGTGSQYGHVMLSDTYSVTTPSKDDSGASASIAASAYALQTAYNNLSSSLSSYGKTLGSTDISSLGDGTVTGALSSLNSNIGNINSKIGSTSISGIGDGSITGALSSLNADLSSVGSKVELQTSKIYTARSVGNTATHTFQMPKECISYTYKHGILFAGWGTNSSAIPFRISTDSFIINNSANYSGLTITTTLSSSNLLTITCSDIAWGGVSLMIII